MSIKVKRHPNGCLSQFIYVNLMLVMTLESSVFKSFLIVFLSMLLYWAIVLCDCNCQSSFSKMSQRNTYSIDENIVLDIIQCINTSEGNSADYISPSFIKKCANFVVATPSFQFKSNVIISQESVTFEDYFQKR